jgi:TnpA family transposase
VLGLSAALGCRCTPRLRDLKDPRLYGFRGQKVPEALASLVGGTIDAVHLTEHWDDVLRLAVSVGSGQASASDMLRRLAAYPRQNGLAVAPREIGRIERSLLTLDRIRDPAAACNRSSPRRLNSGQP